MQKITTTIKRIFASISATGLFSGLIFFCASLTPSLLPRDHIAQGILSGIVFTAGYGIGKAGYVLWKFMGLKDIPYRATQITKRLLGIILILAAVIMLSRMTTWQNSIRLLMEMKPLDTAFPITVFCVAGVTSLIIISLAYLLLAAATRVVKFIDRYLPRRVSIVLGSTVFVLLLISFVNRVILKTTLNALDESFAAMNRLLDDKIAAPQNTKSSGSEKSLIDWKDIGRNGKLYITDGPTKSEIESVIQRKAKQPIRVYAGFSTGDTLEESAKTALDELIRVGGFNRSILIIANPTGTGWLDPSAVNTVEFIHAGDIATVAIQYSYLPSWLTLMVEPQSSRLAASALFHAVYNHWTNLPHDQRPELYLHGLSLGALGSESSSDLLTIISDPINGALWSGPPFLSTLWNKVTANRNPGSPQSHPVFRESKIIRFMTQDGFPDLTDAEWGPVRVVYLQHASDPMSFFSTDLIYDQPDWLKDERGRDVSPHLRWFPVVTFLQVGFDVPMATNVPLGYGHNFAPAEYIDAWIEVTQPKNWSDTDTIKLKNHFIDFNPSPL